ncbi:hypothetical protein OGAPHI_001629 [Ogataea philodendri]|uniref:Uncharacterized protein n=1 Tax=Ogataea philodendri TaxID=1378263 RepID=A0A9P8PC32_9ASCO|nr:uncharacterized protein OGAPHI_001629 [Ogataea philodendri]KAH3669508.1 hypothetical protein OGAPHI_001629 [Ogataea philodendri]
MVLGPSSSPIWIVDTYNESASGCLMAFSMNPTRMSTIAGVGPAAAGLAALACALALAFAAFLASLAALAAARASGSNGALPLVFGCSAGLVSLVSFASLVSFFFFSLISRGSSIDKSILSLLSSPTLFWTRSTHLRMCLYLATSSTDVHFEASGNTLSKTAESALEGFTPTM